MGLLRIVGFLVAAIKNSKKCDRIWDNDSVLTHKNCLNIQAFTNISKQLHTVRPRNLLHFIELVTFQKWTTLLGHTGGVQQMRRNVLPCQF